MKRLFSFLLAVSLFTIPAHAAGGQASSADPSVCAHQFEVSVIREATCAEKGLLAYACAKCGLTYTAETLPDGAHDYQLTETTATCTEDGEATYTCSRCGDTYSEAVQAAGHVPEEAPATCTHSQRCAVCGQVLTPATGHDYVYQYDAQRDEAGEFLSFGTWKCASCGDCLDATEGNAVYYYSLPEAEAAMAEASGTDTQAPAAETEASGTDAGSADSPADPQTGLWIAVSAAALAAIVLEAVILVRSLRRKSSER